MRTRPEHHAWIFVAIITFGLSSAGSLFAQQAATPPTTPNSPTQGAVDFAREIRPLFKERCYACHGALQQKSQLRVDTVESIRRGGEGGPAVVVGKPDASELIARVTSTDLSTRMPPEGHPLTAAQIATLRRWIEQGAPAPAIDQPAPDPREHWSFRPPVRARLPARTAGPSVGRTPANPVDAFVYAKLDREKLAPRPLADKPTLLRRLTLDLIGLPPTPEELHAFLADESTEAYERVVDRLLQDPRYGERWGRHWMDIWRYADWHGRRHVPDVWNSAPQVWRWRDWIVQSLNADHGYDRMVRAMLAGDELADEDPEAAVATSYLIRNWYALNPNDWMRANVEHTSKAFLGLTVHCAHCHDHKYDPILQDDYFRLRAVFEPIGVRQDRVAGEADPGPFQEYDYSVLRKIQRLGAVQVYDKQPDAPTWFYTGGDERNRVKERGGMKPAVPLFLGGDQVAIEPISLPAHAWYPALRPEIGDTILRELLATITTLEGQLPTVRAEVAKAVSPLRDAVAQAEVAFAKISETPPPDDRSRALVGRQSLVLSAGTGRRAIQNLLAKTPTLTTGSTISLQLQIVEDTHVNFQLAKDVVAGLTACYVGFEKGRILAYHPGGFSEFQAGAYDLAKERRFQLTLAIDREADRCLLTIVTLPDQRVLVERTPIALNGWNPAQNSHQGISFDARPGALAAVDELRISGAPDAAGQSPILWECGFEPPAFEEGRDLEGRDGWQISQFSQAPGESRISATIGDGPLAAASRQVSAAKRALAAVTLREQSLVAKLDAAKAELASVEKRLAADRIRHHATNDAAPGSSSLDSLIRDATDAYRAAQIKRAEADVLTHDQSLAAAESKPASDANRAKELDAATKLLASARAALAKAQAAQANVAPPSGMAAPPYPPVGPTYPPSSTGRRRTLARWLTQRDHPLTARVAVNHIWLRHFHSPLVATVFDFGQNGARPTHPELLDWLAVELMESGWSMKRLHRLLVTSEAYRRVVSTGESPNAATDPENKWLWRMNTGRMEAEVVRDSLLYLSGRLDPKMGGQELENTDALTTTRRSLYYSCQPELDGKNPFSALFDPPEPADCYRRTRSIVPQQSLALTNSELVHNTSQLVAQQVWKKLETEGPATSDAFITACYERILGRSPRATERDACLAFLASQPETTTDGRTAQRDREGLVRALLNHNDFLSIR